MAEGKYQAYIIRTLERMFPGCVVIKNDSSYRQGIPDLLVLYKSRWAMLEVKSSFDSPSQPNQEYYVELFDSMSFSAFIYPENEELVLYELQRSFSFER